MGLTALQASAVLLCELVASELLTQRPEHQLREATLGSPGPALRPACFACPHTLFNGVVTPSQQPGTRGDCSPLAHLQHAGGEHHAGAAVWPEPQQLVGQRGVRESALRQSRTGRLV